MIAHSLIARQSISSFDASINSLENLLTASPICNKFVEIES